MKSLNKMANIAKGLMLAAFLAVGTTTVNAQESTETYSPVKVGDWVKGEEVTGNGQEVYIYNVGAGTFITGKTATVKNIENASSWIISDNSDGTHTFACNNTTADRIHVNYEYVFPKMRWVAEIKEEKGASDLKLNKDENNIYTITRTANVGSTFRPSYETRYFSINGTDYEAVSEANSNSKWLFISKEQRDAYVEYTNSFNELDGYLTNEKVAEDETLIQKIKDVLAKVSEAGHTFTTYKADNGDKVTLANILSEVEDFLKNTTTGIDTIKPANVNVKVEAIYNANGVRQNNLTKGINIVKMSDGTTKKIIK